MNVLLMTATVDPGRTPVVTFRDPGERIVHYIASSILWARSGPFDSVVLCENSNNGASLEPIKGLMEKAGKKIEILAFSGNEGAWEFGKGYGEGRILEYALASSEFLKSATSIWKVTGRLYVVNAGTLMKLHNDSANVFGRGDTRFFKMDKLFFLKNLADKYRQVNDHRGVSIEVAYDKTLAPYYDAGHVVRFREKPSYIGQDAGSGNWHGKFPDDVLGEARALKG